MNKYYENIFEKDYINDLDMIRNEFFPSYPKNDIEMPSLFNISKFAKNYSYNLNNFFIDQKNKPTFIENNSEKYSYSSSFSLDDSLVIDLLGIHNNKCHQPDEKCNRVSIGFSNLIHEIEGKKKNPIFKIKKVNAYRCLFMGCKKKFVERGNFKIHLKMHNNMKQYKCDFPLCTRRFLTLGNLNSHKNTHFHNYNYNCPFQNCGKSYFNKERLEVHLRTHIGFKPFKCAYKGCGKSFNEKGILKTHLRTHIGENFYSCGFPNCKKISKNLNMLKEHIKLHFKKKDNLWKVNKMTNTDSSNLA